MISRLEDGAVLIICDRDGGTESPEKIRTQRDALQSLLAGFPEHGMIYSNDRAYHSSAGTYQSGVRSHDMRKAVMTDKGLPLGPIKVLQCKNKTLQQIFVKTMEKWDPVEVREELSRLQALRKKKAKVKPATSRELPTPFLNFSDRPAYKEDQAEREMLRAFRAYQLNHSDPVQPLSKKGISCGNYISYSFKAAIIEYLFPKGLPKEILDILSDDNLVTKKRLGGKNINMLQKLVELVKKHTSKDKEKLFNFLKIPVKGASVDEFCKYAMQFPDLWEFKGYMFYYEEKGKHIPHVMDHSVYKAVYREHKKNNEESSPGILLTKPEISKALESANNYIEEHDADEINHAALEDICASMEELCEIIDGMVTDAQSTNNKASANLFLAQDKAKLINDALKNQAHDKQNTANTDKAGSTLTFFDVIEPSEGPITVNEKPDEPEVLKKTTPHSREK